MTTDLLTSDAVFSSNSDFVIARFWNTDNEPNIDPPIELLDLLAETQH